MGGLRLDSRDGLLKGGRSGPAIVPGDPDNSLLIQAVRQTRATLKMPKGGRLKPSEIDALTAWVRAGALWPAFAAGSVATGGSPAASAGKPSAAAGPTAPDVASGKPANAPAAVAGVTASASPAYVIKPEQRAFWSFQPLHAAPVPAVSHTSWPKTDIDRFILARLEGAGLAPVRAADKRTLLRRATLDLTGLPPTPEEIDAFDKDDSPDAFAKVVDRLLASPHYGETWGRLWLDVARYGEDDYRRLDPKRRGYNPYPNAYLYRDWVIKAFNDDLPYDQFVQCAARRRSDRTTRRRVRACCRRSASWAGSLVLRQRLGGDHPRRRAARPRRRRLARLPGPDGRLRPLPRSQVRSDSARTTTTRWPASSSTRRTTSIRWCPRPWSTSTTRRRSRSRRRRSCSTTSRGNEVDPARRDAGAAGREVHGGGLEGHRRAEGRGRRRSSTPRSSITSSSSVAPVPGEAAEVLSLPDASGRR